VQPDALLAEYSTVHSHPTNFALNILKNGSATIPAPSNKPMHKNSWFSEIVKDLLRHFVGGFKLQTFKKLGLILIALY